MSDILEAVRNLGQGELDVCRDVLETLVMYLEKYESYAENSIALYRACLDEIPSDAEVFQQDINDTVRTHAEKKEEEG